MKKLVLSSLFIGLAALTVNAQNVTIPDANFKAYLVGNASINTNSDSEIQVTEAAAFTGTITCNNLGINSVTGLEAFTGITGLYLFMNNLTSLDVSANTALYILNCRNNQLTALDLSNNLNLLDVNCSQNDITSLDLSLQTSLIGIDCTENLLTSLNVANGNNSNVININFMAQQNPFLTCIEVDDAAWSTTNWVNHDAGASFSEDCAAACVVNIPDANFKAYLVGNMVINANSDAEIQCNEAAAYNNQLNCTGLNISDLTGIEAFTAMTSLHCENNLLTSLDVSACSSLLYLYCQDNALTSLNFSPAIRELACTNNQLTSIDLIANTQFTVLFCNNNLLTSLNVANGNNQFMNPNGFNTTGNPNLTCIEVDNAYFSLDNWWYIDTWTSYSIDCNSSIGCTVTIPDANFKAYLVGNAAINTNGDTEIQCAEATSFTGSINCSSSTIANLTGIEAFTALTSLDCSDNQLTSLNVSSNTALTLLNCSDNQLTALNTSSNTALAILRCAHNELTSLNVSTNTALTTLNCFDNQLTSLNISGNTALTILDCRSNLLTALNVKNTNNTDFISFTTTGNPLLTCIQVDDEAYSTTNWTGSNFMFDAQHDFSENCILSVEESQMEIVNSYPNPASEQLFIEFNENSEITIVSLLGETVQKCTVSKGINTIDVTDFRNGIYFIQTPNGSKRKFVKG